MSIMFLRFELVSLVVQSLQFYQLGFFMKFFDQIGIWTFLVKSMATKRYIDPIKLNYKWKELEQKKFIFMCKKA